MNRHQRMLHERPFRHYTILALRTVLLVVGLSILTSGAWNLFAPEILGVEPMGVKNALGLVVLGLILASIIRIALGESRNAHDTPQQP